MMLFIFFFQFDKVAYFLYLFSDLCFRRFFFPNECSLRLT